MRAALCLAAVLLAAALAGPSSVTAQGTIPSPPATPCPDPPPGWIGVWPEPPDCIEWPTPTATAMSGGPAPAVTLTPEPPPPRPHHAVWLPVVGAQ